VPDLVANDLCVSFGRGASRVEALRDVSAAFTPGFLHVIAGPSGSGKTTLLTILGAMQSPDAGRVRLGDLDIFALGQEARSAFRRTHIGYVFQAFRLMRALSAAENILLALELHRDADAASRCRESLDLVGLSFKASLTPTEMSGGGTTARGNCAGNCTSTGDPASGRADGKS
jgi:putative ABC transport system ATP-binding protein